MAAGHALAGDARQRAARNLRAASRRTRATAAGIRTRIGRLPIRLKLTLAFAGLMVVLFGGVALALYFRFEAGLDAGIAASLQARAADIASVARAGGPAQLALRPAPHESGGAFAEILDADGRVLDSTPGLAGRTLLGAAELERARRSSLLIDRGTRSRLLARPAAGRSGVVVIVVGAPLAERNHALETLGRLLFIGGPGALLLVCAAGYALAAGALTPVEGMRRRAAQISGEQAGVRLPVPDTRDELQRLGETLNAMLDRLEAAVARQRAFVANASHELRTPLSVMKLELDLALATAGPPEQLERALRSSVEEVERLTRLADDLLVIARADQDSLPIQRRPFDVTRVMRRLVERFAVLDSAAGRSLTFDGAQAVVVDGDAAHIQQALSNMLDNALRHGRGSVLMRATERPDRVELHVFDEGRGFPPAFIPNAFERFSRADSARSRGGAGLGLSIVRAIAQAHGGDAGVENRAGGGAHVWLTLPRAGSLSASHGDVDGDA